MEKQKNISVPKVGMNRSTSPHLLTEGEYSFQLNGNSYDEGGEKFNLTDEHSNILAVKFKEGFKFIGGKNHVVRDKTYIFLTNPETKVSEIGCIRNTTDFSVASDIEVVSNCKDCPEYNNSQAVTLENQTQTPHQVYETLLEDSCNFCLGFTIDNPIFDIIIKEQNVGTKLFWTSTPSNKEFRYIELDDLDRYRVTGNDNCGEDPVDTCLDCDKLKVFRLYEELKIKDYSRTLGGNLKRGSYEILAAYSDILGNEFTTYTPLTPIIPIFDEANIIHEQEDNDAETNFSITVDLDVVDNRFDYYKVVVRYYTSNGVFVTFEEGIHNTSDKRIILSDNNGQSISNTRISVPKPFVETVDGATASNNILILNGVREREPINLQPVINLAGLAMRWMSFRAKEDLYAQADSYKYIGYNRDENVALAIDFGINDGYRTNPFIFIPRPPTQQELSVFDSGNDYESITEIVGDCDGNLRDKFWQFRNTATEIGSCPLSEDIRTVSQTESLTTFTNVVVPSVPGGTVTLSLSDSDNFVNIADFIEENRDTCGSPNSPISPICDFINKDNLTAFNNLPTSQEGCNVFVLDPSSEFVNVDEVINEAITLNSKPLEDYVTLPPPRFCQVFVLDTTTGENRVDLEFGYRYDVRSGNNICIKERSLDVFNTNCNSATELIKVTPQNLGLSGFGSHYHLNKGVGSVSTTSGTLVVGTTYLIDDIQGTTFSNDDFSNVGFVSEGVPFVATGTTPNVWNNNTVAVNVSQSLSGLLTNKTTTETGTGFFGNIHEGSLWFRTNIEGRNRFLLELTSKSPCEDDCGDSGTNVRVSLFSNCSSLNAIDSFILDLSTHQFIDIDIENNSINGNSFDFNTLGGDNLFISVEVPIIESLGYGDSAAFDANNLDFTNPPIKTFRLAPLCGCFNIVDRTEEFISVTVSYDEIKLSKTQKYNTQCTFEIPVVKDCEPVPFKYGELGYNESTDKYPDNKELYDSSELIIRKNRITNSNLLSKLELYKESETATEIVLSEEADFRCKNIRNYRLPDNKVSPFIRTQTISSNSETIISPLGFTIDGEAINNLLDVAVDNNLITLEQRSKIVNYKIYRSDSTLDRSVVASGLVYNTKSYSVEGEKISYFNYPFNSLGPDKYFPQNNDDDFDRFQAISPEFDYYRPSLPTEMSIQGYMFGKSNNRIVPVENHSKMVILGDRARRLADSLALLEVIAEGLIATSQVSASSAEVYRVQAGLANSVNPVGIGIAIATTVIVAGLQIVESVAHKFARYRYQWQETFENLGTPYNFGYYNTAGSNYNYLKTLQTDGDRLRGLSTRKYLKPGLLNVSDTTSGSVIKINNIDKEESAFFTLGNYPINNLNPEYTSFDNSNTSPNFSSQVLSSEIGCQTDKSPEVTRNIASPYVAFKNFIPNQYGTVDSIKWIDTTYCIPIQETGVCNGILGGDTFITRHSKKRKTRLFETDLLGSADLTPFPYRFNANYGEPRYYIDYKVNSDFRAAGRVFPEIFYGGRLDCVDSNRGFYVEPPGKFYLYNIAFTNFLCETRINTNFRNARTEPWNQFYPQNTDYEAITQPDTVSLTRPENFFYNKAYLQSNILNTAFILPDYYSSEDERVRAYNRNSVIYSLPDVNENSIAEPWLLYRPNDRATLESTYGDLINMKGIESDQILMYFENALQLQNSVNQFTDGSTQYNSDLGNGGIFAKRAITLRTTDIGYGGTQSKNTLSCEFGHFHVDIKRGQVFNYIGGTDMQEISRYSNGRPNGMDVWFKEHLPLKFSKQFPEYVLPDNPYNGTGIHWGYDSKYRRVILTKKDYVTATGVKLTYEPDNNTFNGLTFQEQVDNGNLKDISWTLTYKPETGSWESYMSYNPNYYINHTDYFQSGINSNNDQNGLWSHLLSNKSYRVFYGQKFPYVIEYPVKNEYFSKRIESFNWNAQLRRYHNEYDFAPIEENPFTAVTIYNDYENSGRLIPVKNTGRLSQLSKYPITKPNNTQEVLTSYDNYRYNLDYFYNRVNSNTNNQPIWLWDENQIDKTINEKAVSFYGKRTLERLKGNFFIVRLERDGNTNYDLDFRWSEQTINSTR